MRRNIEIARIGRGVMLLFIGAAILLQGCASSGMKSAQKAVEQGDYDRAVIELQKIEDDDAHALRNYVLLKQGIGRLNALGEEQLSRGNVTAQQYEELHTEFAQLNKRIAEVVANKSLLEGKLAEEVNEIEKAVKQANDNVSKMEAVKQHLNEASRIVDYGNLIAAGKRFKVQEIADLLDSSQNSLHAAREIVVEVLSGRPDLLEGYIETGYFQFINEIILHLKDEFSKKIKSEHLKANDEIGLDSELDYPIIAKLKLNLVPLYDPSTDQIMNHLNALLYKDLAQKMNGEAPTIEQSEILLLEGSPLQEKVSDFITSDGGKEELISRIMGTWTHREEADVVLILEEGVELVGVQNGQLFTKGEFSIEEVNIEEQFIIISGFIQEVSYDEVFEKVQHTSKILLKDNGNELLYIYDYLNKKFESVWLK